MNTISEEIKIESTVKGTRILTGSLAKAKRDLINNMISELQSEGYQEIMMPIMQFQETFSGKVGGENQKMMYTFQDAGGRDLCLAPEYTACIMQLAQTTYKFQKDVKLFYVVECFRGEKPQAGRYRQFTQLGVEIINPSKKTMKEMEGMPSKLEWLAIKLLTDNFPSNKFTLDAAAKRGLDYYKDGEEFEIVCEKLGAQKQVCGGGEYPGGVGFAIGIDRLLLLNEKEK